MAEKQWGELVTGGLGRSAVIGCPSRSGWAAKKPSDARHARHARQPATLARSSKCSHTAQSYSNGDGSQMLLWHAARLFTLLVLSSLVCHCLLCSARLCLDCPPLQRALRGDDRHRIGDFGPQGSRWQRSRRVTAVGTLNAWMQAGSSRGLSRAHSRHPWTTERVAICSGGSQSVAITSVWAQVAAGGG